MNVDLNGYRWRSDDGHNSVKKLNTVQLRNGTKLQYSRGTKLQYNRGTKLQYSRGTRLQYRRETEYSTVW